MAPTSRSVNPEDRTSASHYAHQSPPRPPGTFKMKTNVIEAEIEAELDPHSFYTILNVHPGEEHLWESVKIPQDYGKDEIHGKRIQGTIYFDHVGTTDHMVFVENYPKTILGWQQLHDLELLNEEQDKSYVSLIPPIEIISERQPRYARQGRLDEDLLGDAHRVLRSWVRKGIIERCNSVCNSHIRLTTKLNGKVKIIFNYQDLNKCVPTLCEQEMSRNEVIASTPLGNFYSVVKLNYGEWRIPLDTNTKYKTAFTFLGKQYVWNRLNGKLKDSGFILSDTLGKVLNQLHETDRKRITYFRDVMLISAQTESECQRLTDVLLDCLENSGFEMQETDFPWCQPHVQYLGREITPEGIRLGVSYLQRVRGIRSPKTTSELKSILGTLEDARSFTPGFGVLAKSLNKALSTNQTLEWKRKEVTKDLRTLTNQVLQNRMLVPALRDDEPCTVQVFVKGYDWMAEMLNSDGKRYRSLSGSLQPTKTEQNLAVKELKAMKKVWESHRSDLEDREVLWEVEESGVAAYQKDPNSLNINKNLDVSFIWKPRQTIRVIPTGERMPPIPWPEEI